MDPNNNVAGRCLRQSQRYTYHLSELGIRGNNGVDKFRANFIDVLTNKHGSTLLVNNYDDCTFRANFIEVYVNKNKKELRTNNYGNNSHEWCVYSMPMEFISFVETIEDITNYKSVLPEEIMLIIDGFIM